MKFENPKQLLPLNLQFFAGNAEDFDVEAADALITEEELQTDDEIVNPEGDELESEFDEVEPEGEPEDDDELEPEEESEAETDISTDDGRNQAFANLRRERDEFASDAQFIREFAASNGMTVEELRKQHEMAQLEKQAEEKGVPVEILQRLNDMERENNQVKEQAQAERFNTQVNATLAKYKGTEADFKATIEYAARNGMLDAVKNGTVSFEAAYKLANMDTLIEDAKKNAVQDNLASRKKRQQEAHVSVGSKAQTASTDELDDQVAADVKEILESMNF